MRPNGSLEDEVTKNEATSQAVASDRQVVATGYVGTGPRLASLFRAARQGPALTLTEIFRLLPCYTRPSYHPSQRFSTDMALD